MENPGETKPIIRVFPFYGPCIWFNLTSETLYIFVAFFSLSSVKTLPVTRVWLTLEYWSLFCCRTITFCQCLKCLFPFNTNQRSSQFCYVCLKGHVNICLKVISKVNSRVMLFWLLVTKRSTFDHLPFSSWTFDQTNLEYADSIWWVNIIPINFDIIFNFLNKLFLTSFTSCFSKYFVVWVTLKIFLEI